MKKRTFARVFCAILALLTLVSLFSLFSCEKKDDQDAVRLSFKNSDASFSYLQSIDGKKVTINGYMATSSPADGSFMFLMNLPYQSCPFCQPNTSKLSNTLEVYPKKGDAFDFTAQAIRVVGTLKVAPSEDKPFSDPYGYEFTYKLVDATFTILKDSDLSAEMALWQKLAESDVISEVYRLYDYVNFVCSWPEYFVNSYTEPDGTVVPGYYLYASDAEYYVETDGAQWNYGYKDGYFENIVKKIRAVDPEAFEDLVENVEKAQVLANDAVLELKQGNYSTETKFVEKFGTTDTVYTLNNGEALKLRFESLYYAFAGWLGEWEM